jgi:hypothetical protein
MNSFDGFMRIFLLLLMILACSTFGCVADPGASPASGDDDDDDDETGDDDDDPGDDDTGSNPPGPRPPCTWHKRLGTSKPVNLYAVWGSSSDDVYAVGGESRNELADGLSVVFHYDGTTWEEHPEQLGISLYDVWGTAEDNVYAVGGYEGQKILHFDGDSWKTSLELEDDRYFYRIWGADKNHIYALTYHQVWFFNGTSWSQVESFPPNSDVGFFGSIWGYSESEIFLAASTSWKDTPVDNNYILSFDGQAWSEMDGNLDEFHPNWGGFWGDSTGRVYHVGFLYIHVLENGFWEQLLYMEQGFTSIWGSAEDDIYVTGDQSLIMRYDGDEWSAMPGVKDGWWIRDIWGERGGDLYAVATIGNRNGGVLLQCVP